MNFLEEKVCDRSFSEIDWWKSFQLRRQDLWKQINWTKWSVSEFWLMREVHRILSWRRLQHDETLWFCQVMITGLLRTEFPNLLIQISDIQAKSKQQINISYSTSLIEKSIEKSICCVPLNRVFGLVGSIRLMNFLFLPFFLKIQKKTLIQ